MSLAIEEAKIAASLDEVPVGCVIVKNDVVVAKQHNLREELQLTIGHAEILAIKEANEKLKSWRLQDCDLYVTLEPCLMCAGAIVQAKIKNVYFGTFDKNGGGFGGSINILDANNISYKPDVYSGIKEKECQLLIKDYFSKKRNK